MTRVSADQLLQADVVKVRWQLPYSQTLARRLYTVRRSQDRGEVPHVPTVYRCTVPRDAYAR